MKDILEEQKLQLSGCTSTECAVEIGKILNVRFMVIGNIVKKTYTINIRIVNVETSAIVIADMEKCKNETELIDTIKVIVDRISGNKAFSSDLKQNSTAVLDLETKNE